MIRLEEAEAIKFSMEDGIELHGHLFKPSGTALYPLIIFISGSAGLSYELDWQKKDFYFCRTLADIFLSEGFAFLLVNKQGVGHSGGTWKTQSLYDRADDMRQVILAMEKRPDILKDGISVAGHSQGGWVAQLLAADHPESLKSVLSIAGPTYSVREQIMDNIESELIMKGKNRSLKWMLPSIRFTLAIYRYLSKAIKIGYLSHLIDYDARKIIPNIKIPTYFAFAENDNLVPLEKNEPLARDLLVRTTTPYKIIISPGVNHSFADSGKYQTWEEIEPVPSPEFIKLARDFCRWTREVGD